MLGVAFAFAIGDDAAGAERDGDDDEDDGDGDDDGDDDGAGIDDGFDGFDDEIDRNPITDSSMVQWMVSTNTHRLLEYTMTR